MKIRASILVLIIILGCSEMPSSDDLELYAGKSIRMKFMAPVSDQDHIWLDGYKFIHLDTDTAANVENAIGYNPEFRKLSVDQDSVIFMNSSNMFIPTLEGHWRKQVVTEGLMAIYWIKAFNTITKNYRDDRYEMVGTAGAVALSSVVHIQSTDGKNIVIKKPSNYPVIIEATR